MRRKYKYRVDFLLPKLKMRQPFGQCVKRSFSQGRGDIFRDVKEARCHLFVPRSLCGAARFAALSGSFGHLCTSRNARVPLRYASQPFRRKPAPSRSLKATYFIFRLLVISRTKTKNRPRKRGEGKPTKNDSFFCCRLFVGA